MALALLFKQVRVVVRGSGDLGSGVVYRLHRAGFPVIVTELAHPLCVRRAVSFASAAVEGAITVDGITARRVESPEAVDAVLAAGDVPLVIDDDGRALAALAPQVVVDGRMAKTALDTTMTDAPLVIGLGPGFEAGVHCHAVIETNRGHYLGRVLWQGAAEADTGVPGTVKGISSKRVLRAPADGYVKSCKNIGDDVQAGEVVAEVAGQPVIAVFDGVLRGLVHEGVPVQAGLKIGDVDPRARRDHCFTISEKSLAIGGGVLEAVLSYEPLREPLLRGVHEA